LATEAGFIEIEPIAYQLAPDGALRSTRQRVFYSFHPADESAGEKPLVVFFNGGPGVSTAYLMLNGTGPQSLTPGANGRTLQPNPASWTSFANLLYIDAPSTGFSYSVIDDPSDRDARVQALGRSAFNGYLDAAEFVRVVLRFLEAHTPITQRPVVLVGESYGGMRATLMLNFLLHSEAYDTGAAVFADPAMVSEIRRHFGVAAAEPLPSSTVAKQFFAQVLIQPGINLQQFDLCNRLLADPSSPRSLLGDEARNRDLYKYDELWSFEQILGDEVKGTIENATSLATVLGFDPARFLGTSRGGAFRIGELLVPSPAPEPLQAIYGALPEYDSYWSVSGQHFDLGDYDAPFLQNLLEVKTFITQAMLDLAVYSPSIPGLFAELPLEVDAVAVDQQPRPGVARPGWFTLTYHEGFLGVPADTRRTVRFPIYEHAGHMVSLSQPAELRADVIDFLANN
jgi:pimeloyl-ACP methyl ester carboxylesterase